VEKFYSDADIHIIGDRYRGTYSGGKWIAWYEVSAQPVEGLALEAEELAELNHNGNYYESRADFIKDLAQGGDDEAMFFREYLDKVKPNWVAVGDTPDEALKNLKSKLDLTHKEL
jgi:hypothetical protein